MKRGKRRGPAFLVLALGGMLATSAAVAGTAPEAQAAFNEKVVFVSDRTTGTGVDNPTGDNEIFSMNPDGTGVKQLTFNDVDDAEPALSPHGTKIAYMSRGDQASNPEGDIEIYAMKASDGSGKKNLTHNGSDVDDYSPVFSPDDTKVAYQSQGVQPSNLQGDYDVYRVNASDGTANKNLTNNGAGVGDFFPDFSPDGTRIAYTSEGPQASNPEGDREVYRMSAADGTGKKNLTNNKAAYDHSPDFSPGGKTIAYESGGKQASNPQGDYEVYRLNASDGTGKKNLTNNGEGVTDASPVFSPDGTKIVYESYGTQTTNAEGDDEVYRLKTLDGTGKKNLTDNEASDYSPDWGVQAT